MKEARELSDLNYLHAHCRLCICPSTHERLRTKSPPNKALFTVIKQGKGWGFAHRAGASTLEPVELEKSYTPVSHLPQTSQPTFICAKLTPLTWAPGPHPVQCSNSTAIFVWNKGTSVSAASKPFPWGYSPKF